MCIKRMFSSFHPKLDLGCFLTVIRIPGVRVRRLATTTTTTTTTTTAGPASLAVGRARGGGVLPAQAARGGRGVALVSDLPLGLGRSTQQLVFLNTGSQIFARSRYRTMRRQTPPTPDPCTYPNP
jgi:hypothetical protein